MSALANGFLDGLKSSQLLRDATVFNVRPGDRCRMSNFGIQDGVELQLWEASFATPLQMEIEEDSERIHFTYVLQGGATMEMVNRRYGGVQEAAAQTGVLHACPGERGRFSQAGDYSSIVVMVRPDVFMGWQEVAATRLQAAVAGGRCLIGGVKGGELRQQAWQLARSLQVAVGHSTCKPGLADLHVQARTLGFVATFLDRLDLQSEQRPILSREDRLRLGRARDLLLADLSYAPGLPALAAESGLGLVKLKRGFRALFGCSAHALFLQERMLEARRRLLSGGITVTEVASDLGYTNISHFAAAFRKQFGVNPGALAR